jgi:hypothetical protein
MSNRLDTETQFYNNLAKLFYAVLLCDKNLSESEIKNLSNSIHGDFIRANEKNYLSTLEGVTLIEKHFGELVTHAADPFECLNDFKEFMKQHYQIFTPGIKSKLWEVINSLALSIGGKNKNELIVLNEISMLFK